MGIRAIGGGDSKGYGTDWGNGTLDAEQIINFRTTRSMVRMEGADRKGHTGHLKEGPSGRLSDHLSPQNIRCTLMPAKAWHPCETSGAMGNQRGWTKKGYNGD